MSVEINLNVRCGVVLTEYGAKVYNEWTRTFTPHGSPHRTVSAGFELKEQMWVLFQIFGVHIHLGMREVPFATNVVKVLEE